MPSKKVSLWMSDERKKRSLSVTPFTRFIGSHKDAPELSSGINQDRQLVPFLPSRVSGKFNRTFEATNCWCTLSKKGVYAKQFVTHYEIEM